MSERIKTSMTEERKGMSYEMLKKKKKKNTKWLAS